MIVLKEITPLSEKDCFYIVERHKSEFNFPIHQHQEYELNFIEGGKGARRVVGDSIEEIGPYELTLIAGQELEHTWEQGSCAESDIREITIQFSPLLFPETLLRKNQFSSIRHMLRRADHGVTFSTRAIMKVYNLLDTLASQTDRFEQYLIFLKILYTLSEQRESDCRVLASSSFARTEQDEESRRIRKVKSYIEAHYAEPLHLGTLAGLIGMTPTAFSRFFRRQTGRTVTDHLTDIRLGNAARMLVDSNIGIGEICYAAGFNNLSNFNRIFKAKRGSTPRDFRALYKKNKVIV